MAIERFEITSLSVRKSGPEFLRLGMHIHDQLWTVNSIWESREILYQCRCGELPARLSALEHERAQVRTGGVDRRSQSGTPAAHNNDILHISNLACKANPRRARAAASSLNRSNRELLSRYVAMFPFLTFQLFNPVLGHA